MNNYPDHNNNHESSNISDINNNSIRSSVLLVYNETTGRLQSVGDYTFIRTLGSGSFGKVKLAYNHRLGCDNNNNRVAIKLVDKSSISSVEDVERVYRETFILTSLKHNNIIKLYEVLDTRCHIMLVMEYACGGDLYSYINNLQPINRLDELTANRLFIQIVSGVEYCHRAKIIHRDLKLENILLADNPNKNNNSFLHIKIADFGLSNSIKFNKPHLATNCGTPAYNSPELLSNTKNNKLGYVGSSADIWSLGIILFAMICGYLPFQALSIPVLVKKIKSGQYQFPPYISAEACDLIDKLLTVDPANRITLSQLRNHPWILMEYTNLVEKIENMKSPTLDMINHYKNLALQSNVNDNLNSNDINKQNKPSLTNNEIYNNEAELDEYDNNSHTNINNSSNNTYSGSSNRDSIQGSPIINDNHNSTTNVSNTTNSIGALDSETYNILADFQAGINNYAANNNNQNNKASLSRSVSADQTKSTNTNSNNHNNNGVYTTGSITAPIDNSMAIQNSTNRRNSASVNNNQANISNNVQNTINSGSNGILGKPHSAGSRNSNNTNNKPAARHSRNASSDLDTVISQLTITTTNNTNSNYPTIYNQQPSSAPIQNKPKSSVFDRLTNSKSSTANIIHRKSIGSNNPIHTINNTTATTDTNDNNSRFPRFNGSVNLNNSTINSTNNSNSSGSSSQSRFPPIHPNFTATIPNTAHLLPTRTTPQRRASTSVTIGASNNNNNNIPRYAAATDQLLSQVEQVKLLVKNGITLTNNNNSNHSNKQSNTTHSTPRRATVDSNSTTNNNNNNNNNIPTYMQSTSSSKQRTAFKPQLFDFV